MLKSIYRSLEEYIPCIFFTLIFLLIVLGVILRYVFGISFAWNIELCRYSFVWLTFVGASYVRRDDGHIRIEIFLNYLKKRSSKNVLVLSQFFTKLITIIYLVLLIYFSYILSVRSWRFKSQAMQLPQFFLYISVGIGSLMYAGREIFDSIKKFRKGEF